MPVEPADPFERIEYYRRILDAIPEYHRLTRTSQQVFSGPEVITELPMVSLRTLHQAVEEGKLPGTIQGRGQRAHMIPRSSLIVWLGRTISGYYKEKNQDGEAKVG